MKADNTFPIDDVIGKILTSLEQNDTLVLEAPPGAGKTTQVPLALLKSPWLKGRSIIMLEPRRVAARAAAERMASLYGEPCGQTVGFRIRHEDCSGPHTRILVLTEGILTRWLQHDPELSGVGLVIFDEFHERNLNSDLGLALCLQSRSLFREQSLKLLVMSATLDGKRLAHFLGNAPLIVSDGRSYPVSTHYRDIEQVKRKHIDLHKLAQIIMEALTQHSGNALIFLPGRREIDQVRRTLSSQLDSTIDVLALHGSLNKHEQQRALTPCQAPFLRKIVLATDIAETSLTIDGVHIVIDTGLVRKPKFDARNGITRLQTYRHSKASATQRAGRAGRLGPGVCYRLWSEQAQKEREEHSPAEILNTDLAPLALQLFQWGARHPSELNLLDQPSEGAFQQAMNLLSSLGALAINEQGKALPQLSVDGLLMAELPTHPRLASMLLFAQKSEHSHYLKQACELSALLSERTPGSIIGCNIQRFLTQLNDKSKPSDGLGEWRKRTQKQATKLQQSCERLKFTRLKNAHDEHSLRGEQLTGLLLAKAFPDRIARRIGPQEPRYKLSNGRHARISEIDELNSEQWIVIADAGGRHLSNDDHIYLAASFAPTLLDTHLKSLLSTELITHWDETSGRFIAEQRQALGLLNLSRQVCRSVSAEQRQQALCRYLCESEFKALNWSDECKQWLARVALVKQHISEPEAWPDTSNKGLIAKVGIWLTPYLSHITHMNELKQLKLMTMLKTLLDWSQKQTLDEYAPLNIQVPTGSQIRIDYDQVIPVLAVKLQEMFGCVETPSIAKGKLALSVHLLSPARRPLQITQDLAGFWQGSYEAVKKEMKGRYPKHSWPDDPLLEPASKYTKHRKRK